MRKQKITNPIRITTLGLDKRSQEVLRMAFSSVAKGECILSDSASADVGLCNMDSHNANTLWSENKTRYPERPMVVISIKKPQLENCTYVKKPINITVLVDAIKGAFSSAAIQHSATYATNGTHASTQEVQLPPQQPEKSIQETPMDSPLAPVEQWNDESNTSINYYSPADYLQEELQNAVTQANEKNLSAQYSVKLNDVWLHIAVDPVHNKVVSEISDQMLKPLCTTPRYCIEARLKFLSKNRSHFDVCQSDKPYHECSIDQFIWKIALWTSAGRLSKDMSPSTSIQLKHWPNLTRLTQSENDIRIAALLSEQPAAPALISKVLGIPISQIFSFYAAAHALNLAAPVVNVAKKPAFNIQQKSKHHSLFSKILEKFSG
ncbi:MAG: hypothetical protein L3J89_00970 [Gammaproteobacteria bacterium]|nr:hypothetical protein [Gammaproteobacteria bacterium]